MPSIAGACKHAATAIAQARALFARSPAPNDTGDATALVRRAGDETIGTATRMGELSGQMVHGHRSFARRSAVQLHALTTTDDSLDRQLSRAQRLTQAGAARLDAIAAANRATIAGAGAARTPAAQRAVLATLRNQVARAQQVVDDTRRQGAGLARGIRSLSYGDTPLSPGAPLQDPPYDDGSEIPQGKSAEEVKKWWDSLPPDRQRYLRDHWDEKLGDLDGIPVADRDYANRRVMQRDIDRLAEVASSRGVTVEQVLAHPDQYGMAGPMMTRHDNAVTVRDALTQDSTATHGAPTFLQTYQPEAFHGDGRAAIAIGNPDQAKNTAVVVPGTGNSVGSGWLSSHDATNLYNQSNAADRSHDTAVVAWMGYDAPDALYDPRVGTTGLAHDGGRLLAADVNALNVTHDVAHVGAGHMTVLGHSYGSTTVSDAAAAYGMHADDVVLVGCPGTDYAHSAGDFHLNPGGHLYVGAASSDPVTQLGSIPQIPMLGTDFSVSLGDDPAMDGYGSTRFKAEVPGVTTPWSDHSQYYTQGDESLFSMSDIVSGHGDALAHDGMTAPHRTSVLGEIGDFLDLPPLIVDPELPRPGTSGHDHQ